MTPAPSRPQATIAVIPPWITAIAIVGFVVLALIASGNRLVPGDTWIMERVQDLPTTPWKRVFDAGNLLGTTPASPLVLGCFAVIMLVRKDFAAALFCLVLLGFRGLAMFAKGVFDSPRPTADLAAIRDTFDGFGFPSGHSVTATVVAGACAFVLPRLIGDRRVAHLAIAVVMGWAVLCGGARMWFGAHWPSDVLGGLLLGVSMIAVSLEIARWFTGKFTSRP